MPCPLCQSETTQHYARDKRREYYQCERCALVFADPQTWPSPDVEKSEYDLHENDVNDAGYNQFLSRMHNALNDRLKDSAHVLDFGCGPAPALAQQLRNSGFSVSLYDIYYYNEPSTLTARYDAIVLTEVLEHIHQPLKVLSMLWQQLNPSGILAIMTQRVINQERFKTWTYKNDPTHVCFYSEATFTWLTDTLGAKSCEYQGRDMVFLTKRPQPVT